MAAEARRNGKLYYYRKRREGNRVISEYVGGGQLVILAERQAQIERERKQREREQLRAARMSMAQVDQQLDNFSRMVDSLMEAHLVALGFHQHKGQWRKKRNGSQA